MICRLFDEIFISFWLIKICYMITTNHISWQLLPTYQEPNNPPSHVYGVLEDKWSVLVHWRTFPRCQSWKFDPNWPISVRGAPIFGLNFVAGIIVLVREAVRKNKLHISWHWPKRWVGLGSNPNFFFLKNCDIYNRWVGAKHSCHNFINSKFCSKISTFPIVCQKWVNEKVWNCILLYIIIKCSKPALTSS